MTELTLGAIAFAIRLGNRKSSERSPASATQAPTVFRVCSVISNFTGRCVFCCITIARADPAALDNIPNAERHQVAAAQLAVDSEIERGEIAGTTFDLQPEANRPNLRRLQRQLLPKELALVPRAPDRLSTSVHLTFLTVGKGDRCSPLGRAGRLSGIRQVWRPRKRSFDFGSRPEADTLCSQSSAACVASRQPALCARTDAEFNASVVRRRFQQAVRAAPVTSATFCCSLPITSLTAQRTQTHYRRQSVARGRVIEPVAEGLRQ